MCAAPTPSTQAHSHQQPLSIENSGTVGGKPSTLEISWGNYAVDLSRLCLSFIRMAVVGVAFDIIFGGIHHSLRLSALPALFFGCYYLYAGLRALLRLTRRQYAQWQAILVQLYRDSCYFFWGNLIGFFGWFCFGLIFKQKGEAYYAWIWMFTAVAAVAWMSWRIALLEHQVQVNPITR